MICKICGTSVADGQTVCDFCGSPIKTETPATGSISNSMPSPETTQPDTTPAPGIIPTPEPEEISYQEPVKPKQMPTSTTEVDPFSTFAPVETYTSSHKANKEKRGNHNLAIYVMLGAIVALVCFIVIVFFVFRDQDSSVDEPSTKISQRADKNADKEDREEKKEKDLIDMEQLDAIIAADANSADISVCIVDIKNDTTYETSNAGQLMSASALVNLPVLYTVAKGLDSGFYAWDDQILFQYRYAGRGSLKQDQDGNTFDLHFLIQQMLNYSDNNATNSLIDHLGREYINSVCNIKTFDSVDIQRYLGESAEYKDNYISARDAAKMLAELYTSSNDNINKEYLLSNFTIYDEAGYRGIGKNLPGDAIFLNHNAVTDSIYNEVAIVNSADSEYIISVLCNNGQMATSTDTVSRISDYVYTALNQ